VFLANGADALNFSQLPTTPSTLVDRVFDGHDTCPGQVRVLASIDVLSDLLGGKASVVAFEEAN
jgi:hypothetical protein